MNAYLALAVAIVAEVAATSALKATDGFSRLGPALVVTAGYGVAFYCLSIALRTVPVGVVYAIWSGVGIVLVSLAAFALYGQRIDAAGWAGIALIVVGVAVLQLFSASAAH